MQASPSALITGITGQDGAHLAEFLLGRGYVVHGVRLYSATDDTQRLRDILDHPRFHLYIGDLNDGGSLARLIRDCAPDEIYNLAAQSHVHASFKVPEATAQINALGPLRLLEAIRLLGREHEIKFYQASSSEMFGNAPAPQSEDTPFTPCSPYAAAKLYAYWLVRNYRDAYGMFACNGILFNHESALRGQEFVTQKIARGVAALASGHDAPALVLGNLNSRRDWGDARDYVRGMWMMLQRDTPDDYVLGTGQSYSVRDFVNAAFDAVGFTLTWTGIGVGETARCARTGRLLVSIDPSLFRPTEVNNLIADAAKARTVLGWAPETDFQTLVRDMVATAMDNTQKSHGDDDWTNDNDARLA